jgi:hypothetical protein
MITNRASTQARGVKVSGIRTSHFQGRIFISPATLEIARRFGSSEKALKGLELRCHLGG